MGEVGGSKDRICLTGETNSAFARLARDDCLGVAVLPRAGDGIDWLVDKSALVRLYASRDADGWADRIERGLVRISTVTRLEVGYSARSGEDLRDGMRRPPIASMPVEYLTPAIEDRAVEVQALLAERGQHRAIAVPDLLVAATAELVGLAVIHLDKDFDLIAAVTGQFVERLDT